MKPKLFITVDGRRIAARPGENLLDVIHRAGADVPSLCHHPGLEPYGACRVCAVEVSKPEWKGETRLVVSCSYPIEDRLTVRTKTKQVKDHRRFVLDLLLARCPDSAEIKALAKKSGLGKSSLPVVTKKDDCILCGLCVRVCDEVVGASAIGFVERGSERKVGTPFEHPSEACVACGACAWICPTRAIDMEKQRIASLRDQWGEERPCRYALLGILPGTVCPRSYACASCEVEERMILLAYPEHPAFLKRRTTKKETTVRPR